MIENQFFQTNQSIIIWPRGSGWFEKSGKVFPAITTSIELLYCTCNSTVVTQIGTHKVPKMGTFVFSRISRISRNPKIFFSRPTKIPRAKWSTAMIRGLRYLSGDPPTNAGKSHGSGTKIRKAWFSATPPAPMVSRTLQGAPK